MTPALVPIEISGLVGISDVSDGDVFVVVANAGNPVTRKISYADLAAAFLGTLSPSIAAAVIADLVDSAPTTLNTLNELAAALADDPNFATTMTSALAGKQSASSAALVAVKDSDETYTRRGIRFINGDGITAEIADDAGGDEVEVTITAERRAKLLAEGHANVTVVNTTTETAVIDYSLAGGTVAAGDTIRVIVWASSLNSSGGAVDYTFRFKIGTTTVLASAAQSVATNANRRRFRAVFEIKIESTTAQRMIGDIRGSAASANTLDQPLGISLVGYGTAAENTATAKAIQLTVQLGTAHASAEFVLHAFDLELLKAP